MDPGEARALAEDTARLADRMAADKEDPRSIARMRSLAGSLVLETAMGAAGEERRTLAAEAHGALVWPPRGDSGFGYDPVFQPDGHERTFGEMTAEEKHGWTLGDDDPLSHRARAFATFAETCLTKSDASA